MHFLCHLNLKQVFLFWNAFWLQCGLVGREKTAHSSHLWFVVTKVGPNLLPNILAAGSDIFHENNVWSNPLQMYPGYTDTGISEKCCSIDLKAKVNYKELALSMMLHHLCWERERRTLYRELTVTGKNRKPIDEQLLPVLVTAICLSFSH